MQRYVKPTAPPPSSKANQVTAPPNTAYSEEVVTALAPSPPRRPRDPLDPRGTFKLISENSLNNYSAANVEANRLAREAAAATAGKRSSSRSRSRRRSRSSRARRQPKN